MNVLLIQDRLWDLCRKGWAPKITYECPLDGLYFQRKLKDGRWSTVRIDLETGVVTAFRYGTRLNPHRGPMVF